MLWSVVLLSIDRLHLFTFQTMSPNNYVWITVLPLSHSILVKWPPVSRSCSPSLRKPWGVPSGAPALTDHAPSPLGYPFCFVTQLAQTVCVKLQRVRKLIIFLASLRTFQWVNDFSYRCNKYNGAIWCHCLDVGENRFYPTLCVQSQCKFKYIKKKN